ncbi:MAG: aldo/keto reductase [Proteobacteria bacterium]|nr:aldo/keto reductase [Pseudomonadota bacterium]MBI3498810.1 aldo/keto reductase [Pseudomonadota bacterium]
MKQATLPGGEKVPALGLGTWNMGDSPGARKHEVAALQLGLDLGMTLIDTAEMYAEGGAELVVGEAIRGRRAQVFLVSKVYPHNASRKGVKAACERSLKRLGVDRLDLYLLHWPGSIAYGETLAGFQDLIRAGKIRYHGVSNLDAAAMKEWWSLPGGDACATDQVLYNLARRGIEWELLPSGRKQKMPVMAYSPLDQGRILRNPALKEVAGRHGATPAQVALAWLLQQEGVIVIPKAAKPEHVRENAEALKLRLTDADKSHLDKAFPPPSGPRSLEML